MKPDIDDLLERMQHRDTIERCAGVIFELQQGMPQ